MPETTPLRTFDGNIADAEALVSYARSFRNHRARRMRRELRDRVGEAIGVPLRARDGLDCIESDDIFVVFKPNGRIRREGFDDLRPLLRQAVVAACAALETFIADKVMEHIGPALRSDELPRRLRSVPLTVGHWSDIERTYERRGWGVRHVVEEHVRERTSTAASQVGEMLALVGVQDWAGKVDTARGVRSGTTVRELNELTARRNRIAHSADRHGRGRAAIELDEVETYLDQINSIAHAIDQVLSQHHN